MWKNIVERSRPQAKTRGMRIACWITRAIHTHTHTHTHTQARTHNMQYLLLFYCNDGCKKTSQCYVYTYIAQLIHLNHDSCCSEMLHILCDGNFEVAYFKTYIFWLRGGGKSKDCLVFNWVPFQAIVWVSESTRPCFLYLGTMWRKWTASCPAIKPLHLFHGTHSRVDCRWQCIKLVSVQSEAVLIRTNFITEDVINGLALEFQSCYQISWKGNIPRFFLVNFR